MEFLKIGHFTDHTKGTGVSVFLFDRPALGAYLICGSSPATHELTTLEPDANVNQVNALAFLGGSAFGLSAVSGVLRYCQEKKHGHQTAYGTVPIVPAVGIYDLAVKSNAPPNAEEAYSACREATEYDVSQGRIGAGTGASIGKCVPNASRMTGGIGRAELVLPQGLRVLAYAVVNCVGDIRDRTGKIIAGARLPNGEFADGEAYLLSGNDTPIPNPASTTLVAVFTNAKFSKNELHRIAKVAVSGMARAISPVFTRYDGDILFCISLGDEAASETIVSTLAAEAVRQAIINAVQGSEVI